MKKYPVKLNGKVTHIGLHLAACILELWVEGQWELTHDEFEEMTDAVIELLGEVRNESYRFGRSPVRAEDDDV